MKSLLVAFFLFLTVAIISPPLMAAGNGLLTRIGTLSTNQEYTSWNYSTTNPQLQGQTAANTAVLITIDGIAYSTTSSAAGLWSYNPSTLTFGTHQITLQSNANTYTFNLVIGGNLEVSPTLTPTVTITPPLQLESLPVAGAAETTFALLLGSLIITGSGFYFLRR